MCLYISCMFQSPSFWKGRLHEQNIVVRDLYLLSSLGMSVSGHIYLILHWHLVSCRKLSSIIESDMSSPICAISTNAFTYLSISSFLWLTFNEYILLGSFASQTFLQLVLNLIMLTDNGIDPVLNGLVIILLK